MEKEAIELDRGLRLTRNLDWNLLGTFVAIVDAGSISSAAERLLLTQSAVSQALKRLEQNLGVTLIERSARRFVVTPIGKAVYQKGQEINRAIASLSTVTHQSTPGVAGHVRLLLASRLKSTLLDEVLRDFHNENPGVTLRIDVMPSADIRAQVRQGAACAGLCLLRGPISSLRSQLFLRQRFGLYCGKSHPLYGRSNLPESAVASEELVTYPSDQIGGVLSPLAVYREQHVFDGRVRATSTNLDEIYRLTVVGVGVGLLPVHVADEAERHGDLWRLPPYTGIGPIDVHLIWRPDVDAMPAKSALIQSFLNHLAEHGGPEVPDES